MVGDECLLLLPEHHDGGEPPWPNISGPLLHHHGHNNPSEIPDINHSPDHGGQKVNTLLHHCRDVVRVSENYARQHFSEIRHLAGEIGFLIIRRSFRLPMDAFVGRWGTSWFGLGTPVIT
jgi:hypothetical protein